MAAKQVNRPERTKSSIVLKLNTRLFFRLLGIYVGMNLLITLIFCGGMFIWAEKQAAEINGLVEERGVPTAEATEWMNAGNYIVTAGGGTGEGFRLPEWLPSPDATARGVRYFNPGEMNFFFLVAFHTGGATSYTVEMPGEEPYAITLDLQGPMTFFSVASRVLLVFQLLSLISNLFKNAGTIKKTLRPIQDLAAAAARLNTVSGMSPEELQALAGKLDQINATHLDTRISVTSQQKELRTLAQAINAMLDRINEAYRSQMRFVSDASHELRTPIAVIQGYAALLDRWGKSDPEALQESIDAIRGEAASMERLVEQLLFLARGDNDSQPVRRERVDLTALAGEVLREEEMIHPDRIILPRWGEEPVAVWADPGLVKQVLRILMDNALKYSPPEGRLYLRVTASQGHARLTVQDEGMGIPPESIPHIFERFYRTDRSRDRKTGGTGLGLSIAKWIVEKHGGWFEVVSRVDVGTRITAVLPLMKEM